jgi:hypothetical protein
MVADGSDGASSSNLHALLSAAPKRFRAVLAAGRTKRPVDELELSLLERTANEAAAGTTPCSEELSAQCEALAREAARRGGTLAIEEARRARTTAEAVCFLAGWQTWLQARDDCGAGLLHPPADDAELRRPAYLAYDVQRYNFSGLVCRIFADFLDELGDDAGPTDADRLSMLHATRAGRTEPGALADVAAWRAAGAPYSQPLDEATRFGCGSFNRAFKASPLRPAFLELYRRFVAEIIAPSLGSPSLVYQAEPVFRVFLPLHLAVGPRHVDASYHAQPNELNFWVPLTEVRHRPPTPVHLDSRSPAPRRLFGAL